MIIRNIQVSSGTLTRFMNDIIIHIEEFNFSPKIVRGVFFRREYYEYTVTQLDNQLRGETLTMSSKSLVIQVLNEVRGETITVRKTE